MNDSIEWLTPEWPVSSRVRVVSTLRSGGTSTGPYASLNLAAHVDDVQHRVAENRQRLRAAAGLPREPLWLEQVHGCQVATHDGADGVPKADAAVATIPGRVCAVLTADCLPIVMADRAGTRVGVAHAGWRGLAGGVVAATVAALGIDPVELVAWLGPAIGQVAFEVGPEVRQLFQAQFAEAGSCFVRNDRGRFQADLYGLARLALSDAGVGPVYGGGWCTASDRDRFFSFRRDGITGRMATLAWLE